MDFYISWWSLGKSKAKRGWEAETGGYCATGGGEGGRKKSTSALYGIKGTIKLNNSIEKIKNYTNVVKLG